MKVRFANRYRAYYHRNGSAELLNFEKGDEADLDPEVIDFIKQDSPKILAKAAPAKAAKK